MVLWYCSGKIVHCRGGALPGAMTARPGLGLPEGADLRRGTGGTDMDILECRGLARRYGGVTALEDVTLRIRPGRIVGLLGPGGSGKTTLIKLAAGLLSPTGGELLISGLRPGRKTRGLVSYLPERPGLPLWMSVGRLRDFYADFYPDFRRDICAEMLDLAGIGPGRKLKRLSWPDRERVRLILTMSREARLYLLDEPFGGVEPADRDDILAVIIRGFHPGASAVIATRFAEEAERALDEVILLDRGRVAARSGTDELREERGMSVGALYREVYGC